MFRSAWPVTIAKFFKSWRGSGCSTSGERRGAATVLVPREGFFCPTSPGGGRNLNHLFIGVSKLPHKTCPFSLQVSVYLSLDQSTALFTLSISASCMIGTDRKEKEEQFHSSVGIPQVRNRNSNWKKFSSWEGTLWTCLFVCRDHFILTYCSVENTMYFHIVL